MKQSEDYIVPVVVLALVCACATGYPLSHNAPRQVSNIFEELKKELLANQKQGLVTSYLYPGNLINANNIPVSIGKFGGFVQQKATVPEVRNSDIEDNQMDNLDLNKRQGRWDYDYGLGGGRFGKRGGYFADYAIGGGRFGRDVDHVLEKDFDEDLE